MNVPKLRFKEFDGEWANVSLDSIVERVVRKNKQLESKLPLTISADKGLVDQITYFNKNVSGKDLSGYYLLEKGEFAYNKSYSNGYPWGAIKQLENYSQGLLSTLYICFKAMNINEVFLKHYFETNHWHKEVSMIAAEGARNHGLLNIPVNEFFKIKLNIPEEWEQRKIGNLFEKIDKKIQLQQQKIDLLQEQKKGYMQKIFNQKMLINEKANWTLMSIKDLAKVKTGKAFSSKDFVEDGKYLVVTNKNIQDQEKGIISTGDRINIEDGKILKDYILNGENILVTMDGVNIGKVGKYSHPKALIAQRVGRLISEEIDFVYQITKDERFITEMNKLSVGNAIKHISLQQIANYQFMAPVEKEERQKIGHFLSNLDKKIMLLNNQLVFLKKQKQGFMQQMFI